MNGVKKAKAKEIQAAEVAAANPACPSYLRVQPDGVHLAVKLQPRASRNEIEGPLGDELRIKVTAPPVDAAANEALLRLLADALGCPRGGVQLVRGQTSRHKTIFIRGLSAAAVAEKLRART
jgi:uncharacterized protein (TIGR00251 family)